MKALFAANRRLTKADLLKEMVSQLGDSKREVWARRSFERRESALRWQRLKPYEKFARMIEEHWDGIASSCQEENKVPLGLVEGIDNKIRVIQRRAYGRTTWFARPRERLIPYRGKSQAPCRINPQPGGDSEHGQGRR